MQHGQFKEEKIPGMCCSQVLQSDKDIKGRPDLYGDKGKGALRARPHPAKFMKRPDEFCTAKKKQ